MGTDPSRRSKRPVASQGCDLDGSPNQKAIEIPGLEKSHVVRSIFHSCLVCI
jgi:hypothetical protein